jgi:hypothetical protein
VSAGREGRSGVHFGGHKDAAVEVGCASTMVGRELVHERCVAISTNTWRATVWPLQDAVLG